jgi:hypothetical protein
MQLRYPFLISARLLPALKIGDGWLSFDPKTYVFYLDTPKFEYKVDDFRPGCGHGVQGCFNDILSFFESAVDEDRYPDIDDCDRLFPDRVTRWLVANEYEISDTRCSIDEEDLIT